MKRLCTHRLIKKIGRTYKYSSPAWESRSIALGLKLKNLYVIPELPAVRCPLNVARFGQDLMI
jgi:hypothetical protein